MVLPRAPPHIQIQKKPETALIGDAGYQGDRRHHGHPITPHEATKKASLTPEQRQKNRELASNRLRVKHVVRRLKIFRVLKDVYRRQRRVTFAGDLMNLRSI
ncbi:transposase family protein [Deinococcus xianganensis]|uniref:transposase family protein n=1 Tax=Deinococcus xianganensis TaxID=1507289 RepID=UPI00301DD248